MRGEKSMGEITISTKEYKEFVEARTRIDIFSSYVNSQKYNIGREECAAFLGFELEDIQEGS